MRSLGRREAAFNRSPGERWRGFRATLSALSNANWKIETGHAETRGSERRRGGVHATWTSSTTVTSAAGLPDSLHMTPLEKPAAD